jgi:hypothetical protein
LPIEWRLHCVQRIKLFRLCNREFREKHRVQKLKDGKVCADSKRQGQNDGERESRSAPHLPEGVAEVLPQPILQASFGGITRAIVV